MTIDQEKFTRRIGIFSSFATFAIGVAGIIGWISGFYLTMDISGIIPISPVAAVAYIMLGLIMFVLIIPVKNKLVLTGTKYLSLFIIIVGGMFWICAIFFPSWDVQQIIVYPLLGSAPPVDTSISPFAAFAIYIGTIALSWNLHHWIKWRHYGTLMGGFALIVFVIGFMSLMGYAFGTPDFFGPTLRSVPFASSIALVFFGLGTIAINGTKVYPSTVFSSNTISGQMVQVLVPVIIFSFLLYSWMLIKVVIPSTSESIALIAVYTAASIAVVAYSVSYLSTRIQRVVDIAKNDRLASIEALRKANEKLDILDSLTRHDIMNQISAAIIEAQIMKSASKERLIQESAENIEKTSNTIINMLSFSKEYRHVGVESPKWVDIQTILSKVEGQLNMAGCKFSDSHCSEWRIFVDPMMEKVLFNLLDNSMRHGEKVTNITIECISPRNDNDALRIVFSDNGVGIPEAEKERVFEKGVGKNTGLGLFLVREILSITGLSIKENGVPGQGARFEITVPKGKFEAIS